MGVEKIPPTDSIIDMLDRVLDKGIVVDSWVRISLTKIDLITFEARDVAAYFSRLPRWAQLIIVIILLLVIAGVVKQLSSL